jgi:hypothetical protein
MRTAIFTARNDTTLTIKVSEDEVVDLVQMGQMGQTQRIARLSHGVTSVIVAAGVFKLVSNAAVKVTAETAEVKVVATLSNKGDWPDLTLAQEARTSGHDPREVAKFFTDAKSAPIE